MNEPKQYRCTHCLWLCLLVLVEEVHAVSSAVFLMLCCNDRWYLSSIQKGKRCSSSSHCLVNILVYHKLTAVDFSAWHRWANRRIKQKWVCCLFYLPCKKPKALLSHERVFGCCSCSLSVGWSVSMKDLCAGFMGSCHRMPVWKYKKLGCVYVWGVSGVREFWGRCLIIYLYNLQKMGLA